MNIQKSLFPIVKLILLFIFVSSNVIHAQVISNPSFEGNPQENIPPESWIGCHEFSTPDTQPGFWEVSKVASDGNTYVSLVTRGNLGPFANENEDIQSELINPVRIEEELKFNIDLSFSENWGHFIDFGSTFLNYDTPAKLNIFGGSNSCEKTELLWESEVINHTDWRTYLVSINPKVIDVDFLIFQADFSTESTEFGNILIDNIKECSFNIEWVSDTTICEHEPITLDVTIPNGTYEWQDGTTSSVYTIQDAGTYSVLISNDCVTERFEIVVSTRNCFCDTAIPIQTISYDSTKCNNVEIVLDAETPGGIYLWNTGSTESSIEVQSGGQYTVEVSNNCESLTFDFLIETIECACEISAPNVFTPNGDGLNEEFQISGTPDIARYKLMVFNRAGSKVFESDRIEGYWNGYSNGKELPAGVYYYSINIMCIQGNSILDNSFKGWITIIR